MVLVWILTSTIVVSLISLVGIVALGMKENLLKRVIFYLISFSAGTLIGSAFLHILPEVLIYTESTTVFYNLIIGLVLFFLLERYFYWRHCHDGVCNVHAFTYLNLIGDGFHNFIDGMIIAVSFITSLKLGVITTLAVILHEIPQELGDFGVLVYGGFSRKKALWFNFLSSITAIAGALIAFFLSDLVKGFSSFILPLTAGGFIYIATSDLIPEIHKQAKAQRSSLAFLAFLFGIIFMAAAKVFFPE